jgi:hypothetical protein
MVVQLHNSNPDGVWFGLLGMFDNYIQQIFMAILIVKACLTALSGNFNILLHQVEQKIEKPDK